MLTLEFGKSGRKAFCDGLSRRSFLQIGGVAAAGLTFPQLLRAEKSASHANSRKAVINVYLTGGISHQDTVDLKPDAPKEIRGEFHPIATSVEGMEFCEILPKLAQSAHRTAVLRSIIGLRDEHSSFHTLTGYGMNETKRDGRPHCGSVIAKVMGPANPITPPFVDLFPTMQHKPYNSPDSGYLGRTVSAVRADGEDLASMKLRFVSPSQFTDRQRLLQQVDAFRRHVDTLMVEAMDVSYQRAFDVLTSSRLVEALDVEKEDPALREKYGKGSPKHLGDGGPLWNDQLLIARRLVEAGVRCVTVAYGFWDTHGNHFKTMRQQCPTFDQGIAALINDIYDRGLDKDVLVMVWGEFGRTPKINKDAGRDHWPRVNSAILAGGGLKVGQAIGTTDKIGDSAATRPIHYLDVIHTMYQALGIDPHSFIRDVNERPVTILPESSRPISELLA
ncbi:MAG: DUF1501 domain-containing protein [Planctomycetaceae bacterium]|nr:DUF1501 domain-containing protein [Planctomycetaceae bacterium]